MHPVEFDNPRDGLLDDQIMAPLEAILDTILQDLATRARYAHAGADLRRPLS